MFTVILSWARQKQTPASSTRRTLLFKSEREGHITNNRHRMRGIILKRKQTKLETMGGTKGLLLFQSEWKLKPNQQSAQYDCCYFL